MSHSPAGECDISYGLAVDEVQVAQIYTKGFTAQLRQQQQIKIVGKIQW